MPKRFNEKKVSFKDNKGENHTVALFSTRTPMYTTEHAVCIVNGVEGKYKWCNRPWQRFDYETAMANMIEKLPNEWRKNATATLIDKTGEEIHERCEKIINSFKTAHDSLSDKGKAFFAEHAPIMETEEDVKTMTTMMQLGSLMGM